MSVAVAETKVGVVEVPTAENICVAGAVIAGTVVSGLITTSEVVVAKFPASSVAVQVTVVVPSANPEGV